MTGLALGDDAGGPQGDGDPAVAGRGEGIGIGAVVPEDLLEERQILVLADLDRPPDLECPVRVGRIDEE